MTHALGRRLVCLGSMATLGAGLTVALSGCGFQPIYMPTASGKPGPARRELASVYVENIPERPGQVLRQALQEQFGDDSGTPPTYNLHVTFGVSGEGVAIETNDIATRIRLVGNATWSLIGHDDKHTTLATGSARAIDGVNVFDSQYFAVALETEAEQQRIAQNIAAQIANQLGVYFRQQAEKQAKQAG